MIDLYGFIFIVIFGTLLHFFYDWSKHNKFFAFFSAVNESSWEHMKIALGPAFIWILIEIPFIGNISSFILAKLCSLLTIMIIMPSFFYAYTKITKKHLLFLDIFDFILSIGLGQLVSYLILNIDNIPSYISYISLILIIIIFIIYMVFTFNPPKHFLFKDPINKKTGLKAHINVEEYEKH